MSVNTPSQGGIVEGGVRGVEHVGKCQGKFGAGGFAPALVGDDVVCAAPVKGDGALVGAVVFGVVACRGA